MAPSSSQNNSASGDDFALKSFVTRRRSLARRSVHGPPKTSLFKLGGGAPSQSSDPNHNANSSLSAKLNTSDASAASHEGNASTKPRRPASIISALDSSSFAGGTGQSAAVGRNRPTSMISTPSNITSPSYGAPNRSAFKIDLMLEHDPATISIAGSSNSQTLNQNVLRNNYSATDKKIFNTPQMMYSPEPNIQQGAHNSTQTINLGPNLNHNSQFTEKKFNLNRLCPKFAKENNSELEYNTNIRAIHRQFNVNKFNISLKIDLLKDVKKCKSAMIKEFEKVREIQVVNSKTPVVSQFTIKNYAKSGEGLEENIDWEFWRSIIDHYSSKMSKVKSLKKIETVFSSSGIPSSIRPLIYLYLTNSKAQTLENIYKENSLVSFFSKENDLRLKICETFNIDLRCLKSSQDLFEIKNLDKELLQKVDKDLFEVLRNFTIYYDRGGYSEIKNLLSPDSSSAFSQEDDNANSFYLPSKAIISICSLLLKTCAHDEGVLNIKTFGAKLTKPEIFSILIMLNENYFNFDNEINARNLAILKNRRAQDQNKPANILNSVTSGASSRRSSMTLDSSIISKFSTTAKESELNNIKNNYNSDYNKDKFVYIFNRALEDLFPEIFLYLSSKGIYTNVLLERFVFEFFHRFSVNYKWFDNENKDEDNLVKEEDNKLKQIKINDIILDSADFENIRASINDLSLSNLAEIKGDLNEELENVIFQNSYKLTNDNLLRILDMVIIQGTEFLIKLLLLVIEKNYFTIFKIKNNQVLMKFLSSCAVFNFMRDEDFKFITKKIYESEIGQYENVSSFIGQPTLKNPFNEVEEERLETNGIPEESETDAEDHKLDIKEIAKNITLRSDLGTKKKSENLVEITIKEKKNFGDFIVEALKFEPVIYKYEEELRMLDKEKKFMDFKLIETGTGTKVSPGDKLGLLHKNSSDISIASTITSEFEEGAYTRNSSRSSVSVYNDGLINPELKELHTEKKENKVRLMKLQTDLNNLSLTHKSYKEEILIKNEKLNKIKNLNLELKLQKENLAKRLNDLKLNEELYHSVIKNAKIAKMNDEVKSQIDSCVTDIRNVVEETDKIRDTNKAIKDKHEKLKSQATSKTGSFFSGFGFGR